RSFESAIAMDDSCVAKGAPIISKPGSGNRLEIMGRWSNRAFQRMKNRFARNLGSQRYSRQQQLSHIFFQGKTTVRTYEKQPAAAGRQPCQRDVPFRDPARIVPPRPQENGLAS